MNKKFTIYYAGNPLLEMDDMPFRILPFLEKRFGDIEFEHHDPNENLPLAPSFAKSGEKKDPSENLPVNNPESSSPSASSTVAVRLLRSSSPTATPLVIIDAVEGIDRVVTISDPEQLRTDSVYSPHDWDLALNLKLLLKLGVLEEFLIIGVPMKGDVEEIAEEVSGVIERLLE